VQVFVLELAEADDNIRDLHAGIVDVVLHLDRDVPESEQPHQRVAERGIPEVTDVGGLVRIDGSVLDDCFAGGRRPCRLVGRRKLGSQKPGTIQEEIDVTVRCRHDARDPVWQVHRTGDLLGDDPRRSTEPPRKLEGQRQRQITHGPVGRRFDGHIGERRFVEAVKAPNGFD
jgi:hypothetical protein